MKKKNYFRKIIILIDKYFLFGLIKIIHSFIKPLFYPSNMSFNGWGMITTTNLPWENTSNIDSLDFEKINISLIKLVKKKIYNQPNITRGKNKKK